VGPADARRQLRASRDLLEGARLSADRFGMRLTRDALIEALRARDDSGGRFERRLLRAQARPREIPPDSVLALPRAARARVGVYFVPGYNHNRGLSQEVFRRAAARLNELGFVSDVIQTSPAGDRFGNARQIAAQLTQIEGRVDSILLVTLSKGSSDASTFVVQELPRLPALSAKLRVIVTLSGVVRDAFMPRWLAHAPGGTTSLLRWQLRRYLPEDHRLFDGLASMAEDPWSGARPSSLPAADHLLWIHFPMIPESPRGLPEKKGILRITNRYALRADDRIGPHDGLVETAASILPPDTPYKQWIVRALGDHGLIDGNYLGGQPVSEAFASGQDNAAAGIEVMGAFLRALPRDILE
jgi:hypothetical protein